MNRRTMLLLVAALAVGLLYGGDQLYQGWYTKPKEKLETQINRLRSDKSEAEDRQVAAIQATDRAEKFVAYSLPYDPELARSAYQDWLLSLMDRHEMKNASVNAETPRPVTTKRKGSKGELLLGHRIGFTVRAKADFYQFTEFLYDFYRAGHLHKIDSLVLNPMAGGRLLDITLNIETLALEATERKGELSQESWNRLASDNLESYQGIGRRNIFARGFSQSLARVRLTAVTVDRAGKSEAWFALGEPKRTQIVSAGESLAVDLVQLQVTEILPERVLLDFNGQGVWLELGESLGEKFASEEQTASRSP